jgi:hypothetical protein
MSVQLLYVVTGFFVGLLVGQTGMGGGSLVTPILVLAFGVPPAAAVGTDLLYASITKAVGTAVHGANRTVQWRIVVPLAAGSVPATVITLVAISYFDLNSREALRDLYHSLSLAEAGITDFDLFHKLYLGHNERLWDRYRKGLMKVDDLRWKRMSMTLLEFKNGDENLARKMGNQFLEILPTKQALFPDTIEVLTWLSEKKYQLHLITNGFEKTYMKSTLPLPASRAKAP